MIVSLGVALRQHKKLGMIRNMRIISHCVVSGDGRSREYWQGALRRVGGKVDAPDDPFYVDTKPIRKKGHVVTLAAMPRLAEGLKDVLRVEGSTLLEANFGHFVSREVWEEVATALHLGLARVRCAETGEVVEGGTLEEFTEAGLKLFRRAINAQKGRSAAETKKGMKYRRTGGKPEKRLKGAKLEQALQMFVDLENWSVPKIVEHFKPEFDDGVFSVSTLLRSIKDRTGTQSRAVAVRMAREKNWPPPKSKIVGKSNLRRFPPVSEDGND